jgi:hypothetical protein
MACPNHPDAATVDYCRGCSATYCQTCMTAVHGAYFCVDCKKQMTGERLPEAVQTYHPDADEALKYAVIGFFCVGFIMGPLATYKAFGALTAIRKDPRFLGYGRALAAAVLGFLAFILSIIGFATRVHGR